MLFSAKKALVMRQRHTTKAFSQAYFGGQGSILFSPAGMGSNADQQATLNNGVKAALSVLVQCQLGKARLQRQRVRRVKIRAHVIVIVRV